MNVDQDSLDLTVFYPRLRVVRLLAMDVDGVLTDGRLGYDDSGAELKSFHVHDGLGLALLRFLEIKIAWITGRANPVVERRASELGVTSLLLGVKDKGAALHTLGQSFALQREQIAYIGDDWNDLPAFMQSGVKIAVANAIREVKAESDFVTRLPGGSGAVREVCEALLEAHGMRETVLRDYLASLCAGSGRSAQ